MATRISVALELDDLNSLKKIASKRDRSISWTAAHAIRFYLSEIRKNSQLALKFEENEDDA